MISADKMLIMYLFMRMVVLFGHKILTSGDKDEYVKLVLHSGSCQRLRCLRIYSSNICDYY